MATLLKFQAKANAPKNPSAPDNGPQLPDDLARALEKLLTLQADALTSLSDIVAILCSVPHVVGMVPELKRLCDDCRNLGAAFRQAQVKARLVGECPLE